MPGAQLDEVELASRFRVSRTPIREALIQLASTGFVEMRPRRGTVVPELAPRRLVEMFELMVEPEAMCGHRPASARARAGSLRGPEPEARSRRVLPPERSVPSRHLRADQKSPVPARRHDRLSASGGGLRPSSAARPLPPAAASRAWSHRDLMRRAQAHRRRDSRGKGNGDRAAARLREHVLVGAEKFTDLMASLGRLGSAPPLKRAKARRRSRGR